MPNKHHFLQDLSAVRAGQPETVVYHADDRPYGLIEGTVLRDDVPAGRGRLAGHPRLLLSLRHQNDHRPRRRAGRLAAGRRPHSQSRRRNCTYSPVQAIAMTASTTK